MSVREVGSYIGFNRVTSTTQNSASGIWSLAAAERRRRANAWPQQAQPFSPSDITGLSAWFDAADASTLYDATSGGSLVAADGSIARWEDKSGNAAHATQSGASNRPIRKTSVQGGKDVVRFDGSSDFLSVSVALGSGVTFFVVATPSTALDSYLWGTNGNANSPTVLTNYTNSGVRRAWEWYSTTDRVIMATTQPGFSVLAITHVDSGPMFGYINGSQVTTIASPGYTTSGLNVASIASAQNAIGAFGGDIAELLIYDSALSSTDRQSVEAYLTAKWGIS